MLRGNHIVLAQDRDRLAREPAYHSCSTGSLRIQLQMRSLNDRGDDSLEGELTDSILDQIAKFERAKTPRGRAGASSRRPRARCWLFGYLYIHTTNDKSHL